MGRLFSGLILVALVLGACESTADRLNLETGEVTLRHRVLLANSTAALKSCLKFGEREIAATYKCSFVPGGKHVKYIDTPGGSGLYVKFDMWTANGYARRDHLEDGASFPPGIFCVMFSDMHSFAEQLEDGNVTGAAAMLSYRACGEATSRMLASPVVDSLEGFGGLALEKHFHDGAQFWTLGR